MKKMKLTLVVADHCRVCNRVEKHLYSLQKQYSKISLDIINIDQLKNRKVSITPALFIDDDLYCYGDVDEKKLLAKLNQI